MCLAKAVDTIPMLMRTVSHLVAVGQLQITLFGALFFVCSCNFVLLEQTTGGILALNQLTAQILPIWSLWMYTYTYPTLRLTSPLHL
jgi:hypothetical protein